MAFWSLFSFWNIFQQIKRGDIEYFSQSLQHIGVNGSVRIAEERLHSVVADF